MRCGSMRASRRCRDRCRRCTDRGDATACGISHIPVLFFFQAEDGIRDLTAAAGEIMSPDYISWYVRTSRQAVEFLDHHTRVELVPLSRPDYHMEWPGAAAGGRSLDNAAFRAADYPEIAEVLRQPTYFPRLTMVERDDLNGRAPDPQLLKERANQGVRTMGGALVAALAATALDAGVHIALDAAVTNLRRGKTWQA